MKVHCSHCAAIVPAVWLLQAPEGRIIVLVDGDSSALDVTQTVELNLHLLGGFHDDAPALAHGERLEGHDRIQLGGHQWSGGWPHGMYPVAVWDGWASVRLLRDPGELTGNAYAYLWPHPTATDVGRDSGPSGHGSPDPSGRV
jgi:hypothetical protein